MVSSIVPGANNAHTLGVDTRFPRTAQTQRSDTAVQGDTVELSSAAISDARESVRASMSQVHEALAAGHDAQAMLVKIQALAKSGDQAGLTDAIAAFGQRIEAAIGRGAVVLTGQDVAVQAEPGAGAVMISGVDLRLGGDVLLVSADAQANETTLQSAQKAMDNLQAAMGRLVDSARALEAHQGFLGAAEAGARGDFDADGARLMALQIRQGLASLGNVSIANAEPQAVLSLFRA
ncbi:hypothetical protein [Candidatus Viadribacter manganicus]|uniref:Flagellin N-terminal domain-containing protein n=1 Tax=Candidatus Viadribacter manganicus TaxID=1759059 RepID=A0A1B1AL87_9PROT|nr:hypothetical protein [Candidatus Viadribacter manganicus]ANP47336.1 hypothetical protein ATE48_16135 [Candidatus Viadribacter manganicus]